MKYRSERIQRRKSNWFKLTKEKTGKTKIK